MIERAMFGAALAALASSLCPAVAWAHVSVASGPAEAGGRAVVTFSVGHGCEGADTVGIEIRIPEEVTSVRGVPNTFGVADVQVDDAGAPTAVVWTKDSARDLDDQYYQMQIRISVPDAPFSVLYFPVIQTCRDAEGTESTVEWAALPGDEPGADGEEAPPAAALVVMPAMAAGWNQLSVDNAVDDLEMYFADAQIVWSGDAAYSSNPATADMIDAEDGVSVLESIEAGAEIWVKY